VGNAILRFMKDRKEWNGSATELLEELDQIIGEKASKYRYWPKTASALRRRINEVKTNLQQVGIFIKEGQQDPVTRVKSIVITKPSDVGKMPFEPFEPFDMRGSESPMMSTMELRTVSTGQVIARSMIHIRGVRSVAVADYKYIL